MSAVLQLDHSMRATGGCSSDVANIVGVGPFGTQLSVYLDKLGLAKPRRSTPSQRWGLLHEPAMHIAYTEDTGIEIEGDGRTTVRHPRLTLALSTPDRIAVDRSRVVDFKTACSRFTPVEWDDVNWDYRIWEDRLTRSDGSLPDCVEAQMQWHMLVHEIGVCDVPLLVDGSNWRIFSTTADAELQEMLYEAVAKFWTDHVIPRRPPAPANETERAMLLNALYPTPTRKVIESTAEADAAAIELRRVRAQASELEAEDLRLVNDLKDFIGTYDELAGDWGRIYWRANKNGVRSFKPYFKS